MNQKLSLSYDYMKFYKIMIWLYGFLTLITLLTVAWVGLVNSLPIFILRLNQYSRPLQVFLDVMWLIFVSFTLNALRPYVKRFNFRYYIKGVMIIMIVAFLSSITIILTQGRATEVIFKSLFQTAIWLDMISNLIVFILIVLGYTSYLKPLLKDQLNPTILIISVGLVTFYNTFIFFDAISPMVIVDLLSPVIIFIAYIALKNSLAKISAY
jgi:hypothetical protein